LISIIVKNSFKSKIFRQSFVFKKATTSSFPSFSKFTLIFSLSYHVFGKRKPLALAMGMNFSNLFDFILLSYIIFNHE